MDLKLILRIFPYIREKKKLLQLKIDPESINFISFKDVAGKITNILVTYLDKIGKTTDELIITDATAGVGGNTVSFAMMFGYVHAIEIDQTRFSYLNNNLDVYNLKNVNTLCGDCTKEIKKITKHDVIFIDPPWGGKNYKNFKNLRLTLGNTSIEDLCYDMAYSDDYISHPQLIMLKLPLNYDVVYLYSKLHSLDIYMHRLKKMYIFVICIPIQQNNNDP